MTRPAQFACVLFAILLATPAQVDPQATMEERPKPIESFQYGVEWRLVRAGRATLSRTPRGENGWLGELHLESTGLVSRLYRVSDKYQSMFDPGFCVSATFLQAEEGRRRRETTVTFHRDAKKSTYVERDLIKNSIVMEKELDIPECVHDIVAALVRLRAMKLPPGQAIQLPMSDGKRMISARVEAQEKETVKTPAGTFSAVRYEAFLFNDVLFKRKGRLYVWLTDDEQRLPVQIRAKLTFPVGTISLQLEKSPGPA
jgi:hypothetical protein